MHCSGRVEPVERTIRLTAGATVTMQVPLVCFPLQLRLVFKRAD